MENVRVRWERKIVKKSILFLKSTIAMMKVSYSVCMIWVHHSELTTEVAFIE